MLFPEAPPCSHSEHKIVLQRTGPHYAQKRCKHCDRFMGWMRKPETQAHRADALAKVNELWNASPSVWERAFLLGITDADGRMSPRQEAHLNGLWAKHIVQAELDAGIKAQKVPGMR